jgi:hypothetical protein
MNLGETSESIEATDFLLVLPWLISFAILVSLWTGIDVVVLQALPDQWKSLVLGNASSGMCVLYISCTVLWAFRNQQAKGYQGGKLVLRTIGAGLAYSTLQLAFAGVLIYPLFLSTV